MENKNDFKEERFDSFLNKTIILASKKFFKNQMYITTNEKNTINDVENSQFLGGFSALNNSFSSIDLIDATFELNSALQSLSAIEQSVIFLLFHEDLSHNEVANVLKIYLKTVYKIKSRALNKLKMYFKEDYKNEE